MAVNFSTLTYGPAFDLFSVPVTFYPFVSTGGPTYEGRGIFDKDAQDVMAEDGSIFSDHKTLLYIREVEFASLPQQGDHVVIPFDCNDQPLGEYEIIDGSSNGGGQTMLTLRKWAS